MEKNTKRAERRAKDTAKALRKQAISREVYHFDWYKNLHQYSKNKIHCSCPMCTSFSKTNRKRYKGAGPRYKPYVVSWGVTNSRNGKNWPMANLKRIQSMIDDLEDFEKSEKNI